MKSRLAVVGAVGNGGYATDRAVDALKQRIRINDQARLPLLRCASQWASATLIALLGFIVIVNSYDDFPFGVPFFEIANRFRHLV